MIGQNYTTSASTYHVKKLLGKGKGGYSYLAERSGDHAPFVLKLLHQEEVAYYKFEGNKTQNEVDAYQRLKALDVPMPQLYEYDTQKNYLVKELIPGDTALQMTADGRMTEAIIAQLFAMSNPLIAEGINLDFFPNNFIVAPDHRLIYIDYEINAYSYEWSLMNWGLYYWVNVNGMRKFLDTGDPLAINQTLDSGIPIKNGLEQQVQELVKKYGPKI